MSANVERMKIILESIIEVICFDKGVTMDKVVNSCKVLNYEPDLCKRLAMEAIGDSVNKDK